MKKISFYLLIGSLLLSKSIFIHAEIAVNPGARGKINLTINNIGSNQIDGLIVKVRNKPDFITSIVPLSPSVTNIPPNQTKNITFGVIITTHVTKGEIGKIELIATASNGELNPYIITTDNIRIPSFVDSGIYLNKSSYNEFCHGSLAWGDYDNDGDLDLVVGGYVDVVNSPYPYTKYTIIYKNNSGEFVESQRLPGGIFSSVSWVDIDNDGDLDIAVTGKIVDKNCMFKIFKNNSGKFIEDTNQKDLVGIYGSSIAFGDYDLDGDLDLAMTGYTGSEWISKIYKNQSGILIEDKSQNILGVYLGSLAWADVDNDGDLDLILTGDKGWDSSSWYDKIKLYKNNSGILQEDTNQFYKNFNGNFIPYGEYEGMIGGSIAIGDYDSDGDLDLAIAGFIGNDYVVRIYKNNDGVFIEDINQLIMGDQRKSAPLISTKVKEGIIGTMYKLYSLAWGDYNNDGNLDLAVFGYYSSYLYKNINGILIKDETQKLVEPNNVFIAWGDYDNDNDLDLAVMGYMINRGHIIKIYDNNEVDKAEMRNTLPSPPNFLNALSSGGKLTFSWEDGLDKETSEKGLYYSIRVGTAPGKEDIVSGKYGSPLFGNYLLKRKSLTLNLPPGTYYWAVQTIDTGLRASQWSEEQEMRINLLGDFGRDGGNGKPEESPDGKIDFYDLVLFASYWNNQDLKGDIASPRTTGKAPNFTYEPDGKVDFEDLVYFAAMWNWYDQYVKGTSKRAEISKAPALTQAPCIIKLDPAKIYTLLNSEFEVDVKVENVNQLLGASFVVNFDKTKLQLLEVKQGDLMSRNNAYELFFKRIDQGKALVKIDTVSLGGNTIGVNGTGKIATLRFKVINEDPTSKLTISDVTLIDIDNNPIKFETLDAKILFKGISGKVMGLTYKREDLWWGSYYWEEKPIEQAKVDLYKYSETKWYWWDWWRWYRWNHVATVYTDKDGRYKFSNIPEGEYTIRVTYRRGWSFWWWYFWTDLFIPYTKTKVPLNSEINFFIPRANQDWWSRDSGDVYEEDKSMNISLSTRKWESHYKFYLYPMSSMDKIYNYTSAPTGPNGTSYWWWYWCQWCRTWHYRYWDWDINTKYANIDYQNNRLEIQVVLKGYWWSRTYFNYNYSILTQDSKAFKMSAPTVVHAPPVSLTSPREKSSNAKVKLNFENYSSLPLQMRARASSGNSEQKVKSSIMIKDVEDDLTTADIKLKFNPDKVKVEDVESPKLPDEGLEIVIDKKIDNTKGVVEIKAVVIEKDQITNGTETESSGTKTSSRRLSRNIHASTPLRSSSPDNHHHGTSTPLSYEDVENIAPIANLILMPKQPLSAPRRSAPMNESSYEEDVFPAIAISSIELKDSEGNIIEIEVEKEEVIKPTYAQDLKSAYCYPNPTNKGWITFANLTKHVKVRIFNIAGELVYVYEGETKMDGTWQWKCVNNAGERVASGIYIYILEDPDNGSMKKGKLGVIR